MMLALLLAVSLADANRAREAGRMDDAIRMYQEVVQTDPKSGEAWWYLGMCLYEQGRYADCDLAFERLAHLHPDRGAGFAMRGLCQYKSGKYESALENLRRGHGLGLPQMDELQKVARYHLTVLLNRAGEHEVATGLLMSFVAQNAVTPLVKQAAGQAALRVRSLPAELPAQLKEPVQLAGEAAIRAWSKDVGGATQIAEELLRKYPQQPNAHYLMGYLLLLENDAAAISWFGKEIALSPDHVPARLQIAYEYLKRGEAAMGLPFATVAAKTAPDNFLARDILGRIYMDLNRPADAVRELQAAVKIAPNSAEGHLHLASAYSRAGRKQAAAKHRAIFTRLQKEGK